MAFHVASLNGFLALGASAITLYVGYLVCLAIYNLSFHPLRRLPGPKLAAISRIPFNKQCLSGTLVWWLREAHDKYGEVVRISPNEVSFISAETAWQDIYGFHPAEAAKGRFFHKDPSFYAPPVNGVRSMISAEPGDHSRARRLVSHAFSDRSLREQEPLIQVYVNQLINRIHAEVSARSGVLNMVDYFIFFTFDVIADLTFGESMHCLDNDAYHRHVQGTFTSTKQAALSVILKRFPIIYAVLKKVFPGTFISARTGYAEWASNRVERRLNSEASRPDFMHHILKHANEEKGLSMSRKELDTNAMLFMTAGSETTATVLSGTLVLLLNHPEKLARLQQEVRSKFKSSEEITIDGVFHIPYLVACLTEGLRYYPPVSAGFSRIVPEGGDYISGHFIPGGSAVSVSQHASYHSSRNFADPDSYVPERWLEDRDAKYANDHRNALQPFSFGPRNCVGKNLAYAEMRLLLARLVWEFDMSLAETSTGMDEWFNQKAFVLWEKGDFDVKFMPVKRAT